MERPVIRQAVFADVPIVKACAEAAFHPYVARMGRPPAPMVQNFALAQKQGHLWVTDPFKGYVVFYQTGHSMHLENIAVSHDALGLGIGRLLIAFCEEKAQEQGLKSVDLYTNIHMIENHTLYPKLGYKLVDQRLEDGFERMYYQKLLPVSQL